MISIIIPVYNCEKYISTCLSSIASQTYKNFELLLINDCSTDNTFNIINEYLDEHPINNVNIVTLGQNSGQSTARNMGIRHAKGEYILFMDSDDSISSDCLELMVNKMEEDNVDIVIGENIIQKDDDSKYITVDIEKDYIYGNDKILSLFVNNKWYNPVWNKLIKKEIITKNELFFKDGLIFEDELWSFMLATKVNSMSVIRKPLYTYNIRPNSTMTSNKNAKRWNGFLKILPCMKTYIMENKLESNLEVSRFYLFKLLNILNGLEKESLINYKKYKQIKKLYNSCLYDLKRNKLINLREFVAYLHLSLLNPIGYLYYKTLCLYFRSK